MSFIGSLVRSLIISKHEMTDQLIERGYKLQEIAPLGTNPILLTSGVGAFNLGNFSNDIIAANSINTAFHIIGCIFCNANTNACYEIIFYAGLSDTIVGYVPFSRTGVMLASSYMPCSSIEIAANSRLRAKMRDSSGSSTLNCKILFHRH